MGDDGKFTKSVEPVKGSNPNVAFTILEKTGNLVPRKAVQLREYIGPSLVYVHDAPARSSNPQTAVPIPKHSEGVEPSHCNGKRIGHLPFPINQPYDSAFRRD